MNIKITAKPSSTIANKTGNWRTFIPKTDYEKCIACGTCAKVCPECAVVMVPMGEKVKPQTDLDFCKGCGLCASECPVKCIAMELDKK